MTVPFLEGINNGGNHLCLVANTDLNSLEKNISGAKLVNETATVTIIQKQGGQGWLEELGVGADEGDMPQYHTWRREHCPLTAVLSASPGRYVYSLFTISNPV